ncbi:MAG: hypothetical protein JWP79_2272 [Polaromonas sp.]|jgi:hypothetical protein|nr:hypothetical protein [Polaromonas sp.]
MALHMSTIYRRNGCSMDGGDGKKSSVCILWDEVQKQTAAGEPGRKVLDWPVC